MQTTNKAFRRAVSLARTAERATDAERDVAATRLAEHCTKHGLAVADIIAAAVTPDPVQRQPLTPAQQAARDTASAKLNPKPGESEAEHKAANEATAAKQPKQRKQAEPKAVKPSKPADASKQREADQRVKLIGELRATVSAIYNGPSLAVRSNPRRIALSAYAELLAAPKHRTSLDRVSVRDESGLALIVRRGDKAGGFDPVALNFDAGIFSRLASVGFIAASGDGFTLTEAGLSHARKAVRAASARAKAA